MNYYMVNTSPSENREYCFLDNPPAGTEDITYRMADGFAMGDRFPGDARIYMDDEHRGTIMPSLIGNTNSFLIVSKGIKEITEKTCSGDIEYLPVSVYDLNKQPLSEDYFIINPLIHIDCLDMQKSRIVWSKSSPGKIVDIKEFVLDRAKMKDAPDLFRIKESPSEYIASQKLLLEWKSLNATNVYVTELKFADE